MYILCSNHLFLQSIPSIYTALWKIVLFDIFSNIFFLCPIKFSVSPFLLNIRYFLSVSFKLFINLYIVIKSPLSLLSFSVVRCISFNLYSYVRSSNLEPSYLQFSVFFQISTHAFSCAGTIYYFCIFQFWSDHCSSNFSYYIFF